LTLWFVLASVKVEGEDVPGWLDLSGYAATGDVAFWPGEPPRMRQRWTQLP
jgi:hypothetical protein